VTEAEVLEAIVDVLAEVWALPQADLLVEVDAKGLDTVMVSSHEVVAILVALESMTGIDPADPDVLTGSNLQTIRQLIDFIAAAGRQST
jgi:acyl carrier protein